MPYDNVSRWSWRKSIDECEAKVRFAQRQRVPTIVAWLSGMILMACSAWVDADATVNSVVVGTVVDPRLLPALEALREEFPVDDMGYAAHLLAATVHHGVTWPPHGDRVMWFRLGTEAAQVIVQVGHDDDETRVHMAAIRPTWYRGSQQVLKNIESGFTTGLVEGALIADTGISFPASAGIELVDWGYRGIASATADSLCHEPLLGGMSTELLLLERGMVESVECLCQWSYRPYGGLSDVLLGLVGLTVDRVMRSPETVLSDR